MAASSRSRSNAPGQRIPNGFQSSISASNLSRSSPAAQYSPSAFATSSSSFSARSTSFFSRSTSPTRVNLIGTLPPTPSVRFSLHRPSSPGRSISFASSRDPVVRSPISANGHRRTCMCSPTTHPGSFRCSLHKGLRKNPAAADSSPSNRLNARRSAMTNSLVRIGTVEGDLVKRALSALIRPSSHHQRRRGNFQPRPSRLSKMSKADDL